MKTILILIICGFNLTLGSQVAVDNITEFKGYTFPLAVGWKIIEDERAFMVCINKGSENFNDNLNVQLNSLAGYTLSDYVNGALADIKKSYGENFVLGGLEKLDNERVMVTYTLEQNSLKLSGNIGFVKIEEKIAVIFCSSERSRIEINSLFFKSFIKKFKKLDS